jgi:hypothetical protein
VTTRGYAITRTIYTFGQLDGNEYAKTIVIDPEGNKTITDADETNTVGAVVFRFNSSPPVLLYSK